jgi:hypothetical protein
VDQEIIPVSQLSNVDLKLRMSLPVLVPVVCSKVEEKGLSAREQMNDDLTLEVQLSFIETSQTKSSLN